ncbi:hypothetical protein WJX81_005625 [Elliptochloris bilobata]|uniref:histidine--tRNA ligase n=1 Tax=Elliptochloris bilobata TaxID=381761 RepID=A0AAW1QZ10_9CHLO
MASAVAIGGVGGALDFDGLASIAAGAQVALDASALAAVKKASPKPDSIVLEAAPQAAATLADSVLSRPQAPAATPLAPALTAAGVALPGVTAAERAALTAGVPAAAGVAALAVGAARRLALALAAVAALSCEALQADMRPLGDAEGSGRSTAAAAAAADLRGMLEGSLRVSPRRGGAGALPCCLRLPQVHGALAAALAAAAPALKAALAAPAPPPGRPVDAPAAEAAAALQATARALLRAAALSLERSGAVAAQLPDAGAQALRASAEAALAGARASAAEASARLDEDLGADTPLLAIALAAADALDAAREAAAAEATAALALLHAAEVPAQAAPGDAGPPAGAGAAEEGATKKKDKKKKATGVQLGRGSAQMRAYLEQAGAGGGTASAALQAVRAALDPASRPLAAAMGALRMALDANAAQRLPKIAKGTRDFTPAQMFVRQHIFGLIEGVFKRRGAKTIATPAFELRETLMGKYGEDSKLIYDLADQGGEALSLRYDLTVPFARFMALHAAGNIMRYQIGPVWRRDQPQIARGRMREFYQCDLDIAGAYPGMAADAEIVSVLAEVLAALDVGAFRIKLNHRRLLDAMMRACGVPPAKFRAICSAIDKLDKEPWAAVRAEMVDQKGLAPEVADRIAPYVTGEEHACAPGEPEALLDRLSAPDHALAGDGDAAAALGDLRALFRKLRRKGALARVAFDLSLARGLDYYTGVIYEAVLEGAHIGSVAAGGRYDGLVGMFSSTPVPAVGVSIGVERVFAILEAQLLQQAAERGCRIRESHTQVLVASAGRRELQEDRMELAAELTTAGLAVEYGLKEKDNLRERLADAEDRGIPFLIFFGDQELAKDPPVVNLIAMREPKETREAEVRRSDLAAELCRRLDALGPLGLLTPPRTAPAPS